MNTMTVKDRETVDNVGAVLEAAEAERQRNEQLDEVLEKPLPDDELDVMNNRENVKARAAKKEKAEKPRRRITFSSVFTTLVIIAIFGAVFGAYFAGPVIYKNLLTAENVYVDDSRPCQIKVGENIVTGTRVYRSRYDTIFGYRITKESSIEEETRIDIQGKGMTIVGLKADQTYTAMNITQGEQYRQLLKPADTYVFVMDGGKSAAAINYRAMCK